METIDILPDKLSALLRLALEDLRKVEKLSELYRVDMMQWHKRDRSPNGKGLCVVCLAGSVISQTLLADISTTATPEDFHTNTMRKLFSLNFLHTGDVDSARWMLGRPTTKGLHYSRDVPLYPEDPEGFHTTLLSIARHLEKLGD